MPCARTAPSATRWRKLPAGRQALLVVAKSRKGETYADLAYGFGIGTSTVYRYVREALTLLAAMAPTLQRPRGLCDRPARCVSDRLSGVGGQSSRRSSRKDAVS
jgi:DDE superfamily endonuclease